MTLKTVHLGNVEFVHPCPIQYRCRRCCTLDAALKTARCGHGFCSRCVDLVRAPRFQCPVDSRSVEKDELAVDNDINDKILELPVYCLQNKRGCKRTLVLKDLESHLESCGYVPVWCPCDCGLQIIKKELAQHLISLCDRRIVACSYCDGELLYKELENHHEVCGKVVVSCSLCKETVEREQLINHQVSCPVQPKSCAFTEVGCPFKGTTTELESHMTDIPKHLQMMAVAIVQYQLNVKLLEEKVSEVTMENVKLKKQLQDIYTVINSVKNVEKSVTAMQDKMKKMEIAETTVEEMNETLVRLREYMQRVQPAVVQDHESPQGVKSPKSPKSKSPLQGIFGQSSYDEHKAKHTAPPTDL